LGLLSYNERTKLRPTQGLAIGWLTE